MWFAHKSNERTKVRLATRSGCKNEPDGSLIHQLCGIGLWLQEVTMFVFWASGSSRLTRWSDAFNNPI